MESSVTTSMIMKTVSRRVPRADAALGAITVRATAKRPASRMMPASSRSTNRVRLFGKGIKDLDFGLCTLVFARLKNIRDFVYTFKVQSPKHKDHLQRS